MQGSSLPEYFADESKDDGFDLSNYQKQLARQRNSNTLNLRRKLHPLILHIHKICLDQTAREVNPNDVIEVFERHKLTAIGECLEKISNRDLTHLLKSTDFARVFVAEFLANTENEGFTVMLEGFFAQTVARMQEDVIEVYIDEGLFLSVQEMLNGQEGLVSATIRMMGAASTVSEYARDALFCDGVQSVLVEIPKRADLSDATKVAACECLRDMFANPSDMDTQTMLSCIAPLAELLQIGCVVEAVLSCFVQMSNKRLSIVFDLFRSGLYPEIVKAVAVPELTSVALRLIGNMSVAAQPVQVNVMMEAGLFGMLHQLMGTEYTAMVLWILSNFLESVPAIMMPFFDTKLVQGILDVAEISNADVRREVAYLLSTLILVCEQQAMPMFMSCRKILDLLVEMLGCGSETTVLRCLDSLMKFSHFASVVGLEECAGFGQMVLESDAKARLEELVGDEEGAMLTERAEVLLAGLERLEEQISS